MNSKSITFVKKLKAVATKHSPEILTALGAVGMVTTVVMAVKATPKANYIINEATTEKGEDLSKGEKVKLYAKAYWPTMAMGSISLACFVGSNVLSNKHYGALAAAYSLSEKALIEYQEKVTEHFGKKKIEEFKQRTAEDKIEANPPTTQNIIMTGNGKVLFCDLWSGRYFESDIEKISSAINRANYILQTEDSLSLNEVYHLMDIPDNEMGEHYGWTTEITRLIELNKYCKESDDGRPCFAIQFDPEPYFNFNY